jgi:predicted ribosome-associated RNA-binding protein Tma20
MRAACFAPMQVCLYLHGNTPLWFTTDEAGAGVRAHPSLYTLHVAPQIMPAVTVHAGLGKKLLATDLFMPGIVITHVCRGSRTAPGRVIAFGSSALVPPQDAEDPRVDWVTANFGKFRKNDLVAICEENAWAPVAIGSWCVSADELRLMGVLSFHPSRAVLGE